MVMSVCIPSLVISQNLNNGCFTSDADMGVWGVGRRMKSGRVHGVPCTYECGVKINCSFEISLKGQICGEDEEEDEENDEENEGWIYRGRGDQPDTYGVSGGYGGCGTGGGGRYQ